MHFGYGAYAEAENAGEGKAADEADATVCNNNLESEGGSVLMATSGGEKRGIWRMEGQQGPEGQPILQGV